MTQAFLYILREYYLEYARDVGTSKGSCLRHDNLPPNCRHNAKIHGQRGQGIPRQVPFLDFVATLRVVKLCARERLAALCKVI